MVDIHTHILYGLDDGARTLEQSVAMVRMAGANGTTDIVATPHSNREYTFDPAAIDKRILEVREAVGEAPRIHRGCDLHLHMENIRDALENPAKYAINHKRYVLVEFSDLLIPSTASDTFALMLGAGMIPIVTHPERNALLRGRAEKLRAWVEMGCPIQVTAGSLLGAWGRNAARFSAALIGEGLAHFVASDAHDETYRNTSLREAYEFASARWGAKTAQTLFVSNPKATLSGAAIERYAKPESPSRKKWYRRWWR